MDRGERGQQEVNRGMEGERSGCERRKRSLDVVTCQLSPYPRFLSLSFFSSFFLFSLPSVFFSISLLVVRLILLPFPFPFPRPLLLFLPRALPVIPYLSVPSFVHFLLSILSIHPLSHSPTHPFMQSVPLCTPIHSPVRPATHEPTYSKQPCHCPNHSCLTMLVRIRTDASRIFRCGHVVDT